MCPKGSVQLKPAGQKSGRFELVYLADQAVISSVLSPLLSPMLRIKFKMMPRIAAPATAGTLMPNMLMLPPKA